MEKKIWLVGIGGSNADDVNIMRVSATEQEVKNLLIDLIYEDRFCSPDKWDYGTENVEGLCFKDGKFYGFGCYQDFHIDYVAIPEMPVVDVNNMSFTYMDEPEFNLPRNVRIPKSEVSVASDDIADILSDKYGFCVLSYAVTEAEDGSSLIVSEIEWDTSE